MKPVRTFEDISNAILNNMDQDIPVTIGVLVANGKQPSALEYVLSHMQTFDRKSGYYIDFYLPGYHLGPKDEITELNKKYHPLSCASELPSDNENEIFSIERDGIRQKYYFSDVLFDNFIEKMESDMNIEYSYSPMLILVEVCKDYYRGDLKYQRKIVIELNQDINKIGQLFNAIFEVAKKEVYLDEWRKNLRIYYLSKTATDNVIRALQGDWIEALSNTYNDIQRFRIK